MATTGADLREYVQGSASDQGFIDSCLSTATQLVNEYIGTAEVPAEIVDRSTLEVGSELFHRRQAPNGVAQFETLDGSAIRIARDPMVAAYPLLRRYVRGFA